jgi:hypothetical protein
MTASGVINQRPNATGVSSTSFVRIWHLVRAGIDLEQAGARRLCRGGAAEEPVVSAILQFAITAAAAKWQTAASKAEVLCLEQKIRISQLIAAQTALDQLTRRGSYFRDGGSK